MPFTPGDEPGLLPSRRRRAAIRVAGMAAYLNMAVFFKTFTEIHLEGAVAQAFEVIGDSAAERKAHADRIAEELGATTEWRNGYYMARLATSALEIHFNPPIFASGITDSQPGKAA
jgi:hypothetical protein